MGLIETVWYKTPIFKDFHEDTRGVIFIIVWHAFMVLVASFIILAIDGPVL